jgi:hypothetical protein
VVSTDCPLGPGEIIDHGEDGLLVPPGEIDAMAAALLELINDDERRKRMGRAALDKAGRYDPDRIAGIHAALFQELLDARRTSGTARRLLRRGGGLVLGAVYGANDAAGAGARRAVKLVRKPAAASAEQPR